jgi:four helix bundle protein
MRIAFNDNNMDYNDLFKERTKKLAVGVISAFSSFPYSDAISVIRKRIIRSSTSVASNYRAVIRTRSIKEKFAKLSIMVEEADEMLFWLEICEDLGLILSEKIEPLKKEAEEIVKATTSYQKKINVK